MVMAEQNQVWVGSEDSVIYIINIHSMSCNKQLTDHRSSVTDLVVQDTAEAPRYGWALPGEGTLRLLGGSGPLEGGFTVAVGDRLQGLDRARRVKRVCRSQATFSSVSGPGCREGPMSGVGVVVSGSRRSAFLGLASSGLPAILGCRCSSQVVRLHTACSLCVCVHISPSYKDAGQVASGPPVDFLLT